jgi:hypothetical protein
MRLQVGFFSRKDKVRAFLLLVLVLVLSACAIALTLHYPQTFQDISNQQNFPTAGINHLRLFYLPEVSGDLSHRAIFIPGRLLETSPPSGG